MKSRFPLMTSWVIFVTLLDTTPVILSTLPFAMPGMLKSLRLVRMNSRLGSTTFHVYGPYPGGGSLVMLEYLTFEAGTGAEYGSATAKWNFESGSVSFTVILPSGVSVMPEMSPLGSPFFWNSSAPSIPDRNEEYGPASFRRRLIATSKSPGFTGVPSPYLRPLRSWKV